ncbi:MAG: hypothetical protein ACO312_06760 [Candidatus Nanopelagicaceae bacterium]
MKTSENKKIPPEKIMEKPEFKNFTSILDNFDAFCDEFESRASEAFLRGDQNDGRVTKAAAEVGEGTPSVVREIAEPGPTDIAIGAPHVDVPPSLGG